MSSRAGSRAGSIVNERSPRCDHATDAIHSSGWWMRWKLRATSANRYATIARSGTPVSSTTAPVAVARRSTGSRQPATRAVSVASAFCVAACESRLPCSINWRMNQARLASSLARSSARVARSGSRRSTLAIQVRLSPPSAPSATRSSSIILKKSVSSGRRMISAAISAALPVSLRISPVVRRELAALSAYAPPDHFQASRSRSIV